MRHHGLCLREGRRRPAPLPQGGQLEAALSCREHECRRVHLLRVENLHPAVLEIVVSISGKQFFTSYAAANIVLSYTNIFLSHFHSSQGHGNSRHRLWARCHTVWTRTLIAPLRYERLGAWCRLVALCVLLKTCRTSAWLSNGATILYG